MRKTIIRSALCILIALLSYVHSYSQEDLDLVSLSVVVPNQVDGMTTGQLSKLESKVQRLVTSNGLSGSGYNNAFVIYPKFEIYDERIIEGMQNIVALEVEFNLFIKQTSNAMIFSTYSQSLRGSGKDRGRAIVNAISKIKSSDEDIQVFLAEGKQKILSYYQQNCENILSESDVMVQRQEYGRALGLLNSIPRQAVTCYQQAQEKSIAVFIAYQEQHCQEELMNAHAAYVNNQYSLSLHHLSRIDPSSNCSTDAERLMALIGKKVDADEKKRWDFMMKRYDDSVSLREARIDAYKEMAVAYYASQPQSLNYTTIIK